MHRFRQIIALLFLGFVLFSGQVLSQTPAKAPAKVKEDPRVTARRFFEKDTIHTIRIYFPQCNYWDSLTYYKKIYDSLEVSTYMLATVIIDGKKMYSCGVRFKGESSYEFYPGKKKPFRIKFNKFDKKQDYQGIEEINLNNNFKDPTMMREKLYLDLMNKYDLPVPRSSYAKVYLNDKYWGLYTLTEPIDNEFLKSRFRNEDGNLYQGEPVASMAFLGNDPTKYWNRYVKKNNLKQNDWTDLVKLIKLINDSTLSDAAYATQLDGILDTDKMLRAWAINNLIGNIDAYNIFYPHNYFIYHDSLDGRWKWISLDGNYAFAAWNPIMNLPQLQRMSVMVPDSTPYRDPRPLMERTIGKNSFYQKRYLNILKELVNSDFLPERMNAKIDSLSLRIRVSVYADLNKMYSNADFDTNLESTLGDPLDPGNFIPGLKAYVAERRRFIEAEIEELERKFR